MTAADNYFMQWTRRYPTEFWNDSAEPAEIRRAATWGAVGVTSNPVLMPRAARASALRWDVEIAAYKRQGITDPEEVAWHVVRGIALEDAAIMAPVYYRTQGHTGRLCVQVNPNNHANAEAMIAQARTISRWAPNLLIKLPVTAAGLVAMEALTAEGVSTVGTLSYGVPQVIGVAEAFRRGLQRAQQRGVDTSRVRNYAVIMTGRLDDHLRDANREQGLGIAEELINRAGVAVTQKALRIFRQRAYESVILLASFRPYHDLGDFLGGDYVVSVPPELQERIITRGTPLRADVDKPLPQEVIEALQTRLPDFCRAYDEDGMTPDEFAGFGPVVKTLHQFIGGYRDLVSYVQERLAAL